MEHLRQKGLNLDSFYRPVGVTVLVAKRRYMSVYEQILFPLVILPQLTVS